LEVIAIALQASSLKQTRRETPHSARIDPVLCTMMEALPQLRHRIYWKVEAVLKARGVLKLSAPRFVAPSARDAGLNNAF
jgi:hypothetical protein